MSQGYFTAPAAPRQAFPDWLFGPSIVHRLLPVSRLSKAPVVDPDTGLHLAFSRQDWPTADDIDQWLRTRWLPRCRNWQHCSKCKDLSDDSPAVGCNLGIRSGRLWRGTPSLTIFDVDRVDLFGGVPQGQESGRVATPHGYHLYGWSESPMPPEDRPWGELKQGLGEYVVAPGSSYPWGSYVPVEGFQIPFWSTNDGANTSAGLFRLDSVPESRDREPAPPPRYRGLSTRRALLGQATSAPERHDALKDRITRALGLLDLWGDRGSILGLLRQHNDAFVGPSGFPDPLTEFELERLSRSYARMQRPAEHTAAFLDRQARKSAIGNATKTAKKNEVYAAIRASAEGGMGRADLAALHGVCAKTVWRALRS